MSLPRLLSALALSLSPALGLASSVRVSTATSEVVIDVERPFDAYSGYAPLQVEIQNDTSRQHSWLFYFESFASGSNRASEFTLRVPGNERRLFQLSVPLATELPTMSYLQMTVSGYGIRG